MFGFAEKENEGTGEKQEGLREVLKEEDGKKDNYLIIRKERMKETLQLEGKKEGSHDEISATCLK